MPAVPPWQQTFPVGPGAGIADCTAPADPAGDNPTPGKWGYTVTVSVVDGCNGQDITGKDFGNIQLATKTGIKWNDVNGNHVRDLPGDISLDGWVIHLFGTAANGTAVHQTATTAGGGIYTFTVLPGTYTVCEQMPVAVPPWVQTFPTAGANCITPPDPNGDNPNPGPLGYAIVLTPGQIDNGNDFGNTKKATVTCPEDPNAVLTRTVSNPSSGVPNYATLQAAYDAASNGETIGMFGNTVENVTLGGAKTLKITQCTSARITGGEQLAACLEHHEHGQADDRRARRGRWLDRVARGR